MSDRVYVGTRKGFFRVERKGGKWKIGPSWFMGTESPMLLVDGKDIFAAINHGHFGQHMHRSTDEGKTWEEIAAPAYPPMPEGRAPDKCPMRGIEIPWALKLIWSLESDCNGRLWCGTLPGGLFTSDDRGKSWKLVESLWNKPDRNKWIGGGYDTPGIHSICIDPRNEKRVQVGISSGGVWTTTDAGANWVPTTAGMRSAYAPPEMIGDPNVQDPHRVVQCPASPDHMWIQHHNGIFKSTDGGNNWTELNENFGYAVAVHPRKPETAWFVPGVKDEMRIPSEGKVAVTRTRDGGKTFEKLTAGLPQEHAYDMTFRHGLDIDKSGDRLAFGSTTGSLWISENGGDSWTTISNNLPPIYCVRFG